MAARFWVGGTGNWDAADTTHWSDTSGGAGGFSVPGSGDTVTLDGSSGGGTVTMTAGVTVTSITMGAFTGTLDTNGQTVTLSSTFSVTGTATRTLTLGSSTINCTTMVLTSTTNLTFNAGTSTINAVASSITFGTGVGLAFANVTISPTANATINGSNTFSSLTLTGPASNSCSFSLAGNQTVSGTFTANGNSATNRIVINSTVKGTARTITAATVTVTNADFQDITGAGAGSWDLSAITGLSGDCGGNSGITFTTGATQYWYTATTGAKTWSTAGNWYLGSGGTGGAGRVPLPQDTARFDSASIGASSTTITNDMPRIGSMDWSGVTNSPSYVGSVTMSFFGSVTVVSGMTFSPSNNWTYEGRGSSILISAGKTFTGRVTVDSVTGTLTLGDAFICTPFAFRPTSGTFSDGGFSVAVANMQYINTGNLTLVMNSTWSITANGGLWDPGPTATIVPGSSTIKFTGPLTTVVTFIGHGYTYNNLEKATTGAFALQISGSNTFNNIHIDASSAARTIQFTAGTTTTVASMTRDAGTNIITLGSITAANHNLVKSGGGVINGLHHMNISRSQATPSTNTWYANIDSVDSGNNSGWIFGVIPPGYTTTATAAAFSFVSKAASALSDFTSRASAASFSFVSKPGTTSGTITSVATAASFLFNAASATAKGIISSVASAASFLYTSKAATAVVTTPNPRIIGITVSLSHNPAIVVSRNSYSITVSR